MTAVRVLAIGSMAVALVVSVACEPFDEEREMTFPITGAHLDVACEGCHPSAPEFTNEVALCEPGSVGVVPVADLLATCISCHECDRPANHYEGQSCGQAGCHATVPPGWADDGGGTGGGDEDSCQPACHDPPFRPGGEPDDASHVAHLDGVTLRPAVLVCDDCHPVGDYSLAIADGPPTHSNGVTDVVMGSLLAGSDGAVPAYAGGTCSGTYCHGATMLPDPPDADPVWNDPAFDALSCQECHGWPPDGHFTAGCDGCHSPTVAGDLPALADDTLHIDGCVDAQDETPSGAACP